VNGFQFYLPHISCRVIQEEGNMFTWCYRVDLEGLSFQEYDEVAGE
jgi:hypothetical protein